MNDAKRPFIIKPHTDAVWNFFDNAEGYEAGKIWKNNMGDAISALGLGPAILSRVFQKVRVFGGGRQTNAV